MNIFALTFPKQHGAWSVLIASFLIGTLGSKYSAGVESTIFLFAIVCGFLGRSSASYAFKIIPVKNEALKATAVAVFYLLLSLFATALLIFKYDRPELLPLSAIIALFMAGSLIIEKNRKERSVLGGIFELIGLSLVVLMSSYVSSGVLGKHEIGLFIVSSLFFCGSVFHVRYLARSGAVLRGSLLERISAGFYSIVYHLGAFLTTLILGFFGFFPLVISFALLPSAVKVFYAVFKQFEKPVPIRRIGYVEVASTVVFLVLTITAVHLA